MENFTQRRSYLLNKIDYIYFWLLCVHLLLILFSIKVADNKQPAIILPDECKCYLKEAA